MTILEYIDLDNTEHLRELKTLFNTGEWDSAFYEIYLSNIQFENNWLFDLSFRLAIKYLNYKVGV
jgi:hypothetical protein